MTPQESAIAACLLDGLSNKRIADATGWPIRTVEDRIQRLRKKFNAPSRLVLALKLKEME